MKRPSRSAALAIIATATALAQIPVTKEQVIGRQLVADAAAPWPAITSSDVTLYLARLIANLTPPEGLRVPLQLRVVSNPDPIASMFPGGYLLLSSGAVLRAKSEAELAALLAHEIGHLQEGPPAASPGSATIPLVFVGGARGAESRGGWSVLPVALRNRIAGCRDAGR
jgi:beta-barrel assembly-enhancing protease